MASTAITWNRLSSGSSMTSMSPNPTDTLSVGFSEIFDTMNNSFKKKQHTFLDFCDSFFSFSPSYLSGYSCLVSFVNSSCSTWFLNVGICLANIPFCFNPFPTQAFFTHWSLHLKHLPQLLCWASFSSSFRSWLNVFQGALIPRLWKE